MGISERYTYRHCGDTPKEKKYKCVVRKSERGVYVHCGDKHKERGIAMFYGHKQDIYVYTM